MADGIKVTGLAELRKALKQVDPNAGKELRVFYKTVADMVLARAQAQAAGLGGVAAKSAPALKAQATQTKAAISIDGSGGFPFALGAEFGALKYKQFKPWRGNQYIDPLNQGVGYFMHPALRDASAEIMQVAQLALDNLIKHMAKD